MKATPADLYWRDRAACIGANPSLFDPPHSGERPAQLDRRMAEAAEYCHDCPVLAACRQSATTYGDEGFRAGVMRSWRAVDHAVRELAPKPQRSLAPCGTTAAYHRHLRHGEPTDIACARAYALHRRAYRARRAAS